MRILVFGAGVLGCNLANNLYQYKKDVVLLARGKWAKQISEHGLAIHHFFGKRTFSRIPVIEELKADDCYDAIFVAVRYTQLDSVIPVLQANATKNIVFVGNNVRCEEYRNRLPEKNVLFAFASSAGHRESEHVESVDIRKITIGQLKDDESNQQLIDRIFGDTKYRVTYELSKDLYLHEIDPLLFVKAIYLTFFGLNCNSVNMICLIDCSSGNILLTYVRNRR